MKLYVMKDGDLQMPRLVLANRGHSFDLHNREMLADRIKSPCPYYLIEHPDGNILYDTGNTTHVTYPVPEEEHPLNTLAELGLEPKDIRYVVCSHLHRDHTGWLRCFTDSEIIVDEAEYRTAERIFKTGVPEKDYVTEDIQDWFRAGLHWHTVSGRFEVKELVPGVRLVLLGKGHSHGMIGLLLSLPETGNILMTGDAAYCSGNIEQPFVPQYVLLDEKMYLETLQYLRDLAEIEHAVIWFGHDAAQFRTLKYYKEGYYS